MALSTKPNRFYPAVPAPAQDLASLQNTVEQMRSAMLTYQRSDNNYSKSFVRFEELVDLGIIDVDGNSTLTTGTGGGENQTPWLSDIDGAGFGLDNIDRLNIDGAGTQSTTMQYSGSELQITVANTLDTRLIGHVSGDFVVEGTASGGRIRQENAADGTEYIEIYHDTANTARVLTSGALRLQSTHVSLPYVEVDSTNEFRKLGSSSKATSLDYSGTDFVIDANAGAGSAAFNFQIIGLTNNFRMQNYIFAANQFLSASEDNYVLTYDFAGNTIQLEPGGGGGPTSDHPHTGEVTGTTALTVQVSSITNRTAVTEVSESGIDDIALHDATDGSFKKTPINLVTDGGYF